MFKKSFASGILLILATFSLTGGCPTLPGLFAGGWQMDTQSQSFPKQEGLQPTSIMVLTPRK